MSTLRTFFERLGVGAEQYDPDKDPKLMPLYMTHERTDQAISKARQFFAVTPLTETVFGLADVAGGHGDE